jgi:hypothetical protein
VWEAVYILDGLLQNLSEVQPDTIHADTQGQSFPVFGLAHLLGFDLVPRIRNWKERTFYRADAKTRYRHIDALFGEPGANVINWRLIETHWQDLMRVVVSIREGRLSSVTLLRRLRSDSRRNRLYRAFRELGRVIATIVLLRMISEPEIRERAGRAMTMIESYNGYSMWVFFGNEGVIADNDPEEQEKAIKFNHLVTNIVSLSNTLDISAAVRGLIAEGRRVLADDLASISPYQKDNVKRFGDYFLDMNAAEGDLDGRLSCRPKTCGTYCQRSSTPPWPCRRRRGRLPRSSILGSRIPAWLPRTRSSTAARGTDPLPRTRRLPPPDSGARTARRRPRTWPACSMNTGRPSTAPR